MIARKALTLTLAAASLALAGLPAAETPKQKVNLLDVIKSGAVTYHVDTQEAPHDPPASIWTFNDDGQLKVSGKGFGYVATQKAYRGYHLVIESKFLGPTFGKREGKARSGAVLIHAHGLESTAQIKLPASYEAKIAEGGTGDLLGLPGRVEHSAGSTASLELLTATFATEVAKAPNGEVYWKRNGKKISVGSDGKPQWIHWEQRDPAWRDEAGYLGRHDVQSRYNEWTRMEVIAKGRTIQLFVNGVLVNEATACGLRDGSIGLRTEGAEMLVRRFDLYPLGEFKETWKPVMASGGTNVSVRESRLGAWSPQKEQAGIVMDGDYEAQLVVSEPLVRDPVEITWDAKGRAFVADMIDYPLGAGPGKPPLSRIQMLIDDKHDGHYNRAITFADHVDHVQGLLPYKDGLIATTRTEILFLRDSKGDGVADEIKPLVEGFNPNHSQLQVASPRWGLDNCVYFNNGLDTKEIYPAGEPEKKLNFTRTNLRWDPFTGALEPASGFGQYGGCFDDEGRHYYASNRNPVMMTVMPYEAAVRNPHSGIVQGWEDIAPTGADTRVYPLMITHTTADAHAGTHTAACGLGVYRGDLMPELRGEIFVCEPTAQCVVRYHPAPKGASQTATRVGDHKDFFRCWDEWCRPVNVTTGPDGALYICDIYRRYIDHARFFPEEFTKTHNMREGDAEGRIWRIVPKGKKARPIEPVPTTVEGLVAWLGHPNAWQRETAERVLLEMDPKKVSGILGTLKARKDGNTPAARTQPGASMPDQLALFTLHSANLLYTLANRNGLGSITPPAHPDPTVFPTEKSQFESPLWYFRRSGVTGFSQSGLNASVSSLGREALIELCQPRDAGNEIPVSTLIAKATGFAPATAGTPPVFAADDVWMQRAILSASAHRAGAVLAGFLSNAGIQKAYSLEKSDFVRALASCSAADADAGDFAAALGALKQEPGKILWWKPALLQGLAEGLPKSGKKLGFGTLAQLTAKPPTGYKEAAEEIAALQRQVEHVMADSTAPMESRLAVIPLLAQRPWDQAEPIVRTMLSKGQPPDIHKAALAILRKFPADKTAPLLYELLPVLEPAPRREVVALLGGNSKTVVEFFHRMETGALSPSYVGAEARWGYLHGSNKVVRELAGKLFGHPSDDRAALVNQYIEIVGRKGEAAKGHVIFATICIACHKFKGEGVEVGPDITDVRVKPREALLSDILDPNRMVEARFMAYQIDTKDNRTLVGVVGSETADAVTLKLPGGIAENVAKANIAKMKCLNQSLMPVGLEAAINKDQMVDLLAFLKGE